MARGNVGAFYIQMNLLNMCKRIRRGWQGKLLLEDRDGTCPKMFVAIHDILRPSQGNAMSVHLLQHVDANVTDR